MREGNHRAATAVVASLLLMFISSASPPAACGADGGCRNQVDRDFPTSAPDAVGMAAGPLVRLNDALDSGTYDIRSLLIVRDCSLVFERYKHGIGRDHNHTIYSVTKSVTSTLVGALLAQQKLPSVDLPIAALMKKPRAVSRDDWKKAERITLRNVMQMSSGLAYQHNPTGNPIYLLSQDRVAFALSPELIAAPGTRYNYSDGDVSMTGAVVAAVADTNLYRFAEKTLFDPLRMKNHDWWFRDAVGRYPGGWGLRLRPMDMVKVGQLYLQKGEWNGRAIFQSDYTELAWTVGPNKLYALHWWVGSAPQAEDVPYFAAVGFKGQRIFVFPTTRTIVAMTASLPETEARVVNGLVIETTVQATRAGASPATADTQATLVARQKSGFRGETRVGQEEQDEPRR